MARVQERKYGHVRTYGWGLEHLLVHIYVRPGLGYMAGPERRDSVVAMFMGSQPAGSERNAWSCSSGGLGRNRRWKRGLVYRRTEETVLLRSERGPVDREGCGVPQNGGNGPPTVEMGVLLTGGVWCTAKRTKRTSYVRNGGPVDREGCGVPQNGGNGPPMVETGVLLIGRGLAYRKTDETDLLRSKRGSC